MRAAEAEHAETTSAEETELLAARLAGELRAGDVVLLSGDLGAGKTTFVRGACRALGIAGPVTSPTFTLARRYDDGPVPVSHLDLYRLAGAAGDDPELLEEELAPQRIAFVEWPEADDAQLAGARVAARVRLEHRGCDRRAVTIERLP
jgi:tRNA threonylcarbamoyladenosine biosynthesis protein TsaE